MFDPVATAPGSEFGDPQARKLHQYRISGIVAFHQNESYDAGTAIPGTNV